MPPDQQKSAEEGQETQSLAQLIYTERNVHGWSQIGLAEFVGISPSYLSKFEAGTCVPTGEVIERIAIALHLDVQMLLSMQENEYLQKKRSIRMKKKESGQSVQRKKWSTDAVKQNKIRTIVKVLENIDDPALLDKAIQILKVLTTTKEV